MIWFFITLCVVFSLFLFVIAANLNKAFSGFETLLIKFIESNQEFYEFQNKMNKAQKEAFKVINTNLSELGIIRRYAGNIDTSTKSLSETSKSTKDAAKIIRDYANELKVSKDIATNLAEVSKNLKMLDKIATSLKLAISKLKE